MATAMTAFGAEYYQDENLAHYMEKTSMEAKVVSDIAKALKARFDETDIKVYYTRMDDCHRRHFPHRKCRSLSYSYPEYLPRVPDPYNDFPASLLPLSQRPALECKSNSYSVCPDQL